MISKEFTYTDFLGNKRTETHRFHLSNQELMTMEVGEYGGFTEMLKRLSSKIDVPELEKIIRNFIDSSYGVMSPDGRKFEKKDEYLEDFKATEMYSQLYMELLQNPQQATEFIKGILPVMTEEQKRQFDEAMLKNNVDN